MEGEDTMEKDTTKRLSGIYASPEKLVDDVIAISKCRDDESEYWDQELWLLRIDNVASEHGEPPAKRRRSKSNPLLEIPAVVETTVSPIRVLDLKKTGGRVPYVAVSHRWYSHTAEAHMESAYQYEIRTPDGPVWPIKSVNRALDRAVRYALRMDINYVWIDQLCIDQGNEGEQERAIQAMDLVYHESEYTIGLLTVRMSPVQLDCLSELLKAEHRMRSFVERLSPNQVGVFAQVLHHIQEDDWWKRTWTFQEQYCSSKRMRFLVRGDSTGGWDVPTSEAIPEYAFSGLAFNSASEDYRKVLADMGIGDVHAIPSWARKYQVTNIRTSNTDLGSCYALSTTLNIIKDVNERENRDVEDRLAIIANCCNYSVRLNTGELRRSKYGLSSCILALCFVNGEIPRYQQTPTLSASRENKVSISFNVHDFLKRYLLEEFSPPGDRYQLRFIKHCRLANVILGKHGIQTRGNLWELCEEIQLWAPRDRSHQTHTGDNLDTTELSLLRQLHRELYKLGYQAFGKDVLSFIREDDRISETGEEPPPRKPFMDRMVEAITAAVETGKTVRLGKLLHEEEPSAVFVCEMPASDSHPPQYVFTSWSNERSNEERERLPKFVSIRVRWDGSYINHCKRLYAQEWINGLFFVTGESMENVVFPWPFL